MQVAFSCVSRVVAGVQHRSEKNDCKNEQPAFHSYSPLVVGAIDLQRRLRLRKCQHMLNHFRRSLMVGQSTHFNKQKRRARRLMI
jgi:hypothetical protein